MRRHVHWRLATTAHAKVPGLVRRTGSLYIVHDHTARLFVRVMLVVRKPGGNKQGAQGVANVVRHGRHSRS